MHTTTETQDDHIHSSASLVPHVIDKPNKPVKQSRLPELVETAVRNIEPLDAKREHINSIDARSLAGLDIISRKRKYGIAFNGQGQMTSEPFYYSTGAKPRAFAASPSPEPLKTVDTCAEHAEDMLSFGTPSDRQSTNGTQASAIHLNRGIQDDQMTDQTQINPNAPPVSTTPTESQSSTDEIEIPPTLYEDSLRKAAQTLKLQDALLGVQTSTSLTPWSTQPNKDDSKIRAFNLFTPAQANVLDGIPPDPEPRTAITFREERNSQNKLSDVPDMENRLGIGNRTRGDLGQDRRDHDRQAKSDGASDILIKPHRKPRMETPQGTKPPSPPRKPTGTVRSGFMRGSMPASPLDTHVLRSHPNHLRRTSEQVIPSHGHSNVHEKADGQGSITTTTLAPRLDGSGSALDFASAGSSPSSSQEIDASLKTRDEHNQTIGLKLFDDDPQADVEADV